MGDATFGLMFGDLDWSPQNQDGERVRVTVNGLQRGSVVPVISVIDSLMQSSIEVVSGWENRDQQVILTLEGPDSDALAEYEERLHLATAQAMNTLTWTPNDGFGAPTAFDILWARLEGDEAAGWDDREVANRRRWILTFRAEPHARSTELVVDEALSQDGAAGALINGCESLTGWSAESTFASLELTTLDVGFGSTVPEGTYAIQINPGEQRYRDAGGGYFWWTRWETVTLDAAAVIDFTGTPYLTVWSNPSGAVANPFEDPSVVRAWVDGVEAALVTVDDGVWTFITGAPASADEVTLYVEKTSKLYSKTGDPADARVFALDVLAIDNLRRESTLPTTSPTGRESTRTITVQGSAPTQGRLEVSHPTLPLGTVIVYTAPVLGQGGYTPDLMKYLDISPYSIADAGGLYGTRTAIGRSEDSDSVTFRVPAAALPEGSYQLLGRPYNPANTPDQVGTVTVSAHLELPSGADVGLVTEECTPQQVGGLMLLCGSLALPPATVPSGSGGVVVIEITSTGSSGAGTYGLVVSELLAFWAGGGAEATTRADPGVALVVVDAGSGSTTTPEAGTANNRLWIDAPSVENGGRPQIWLGTEESRSDAYNAGTVTSAFGVPALSPPATKLYVATTNATYAETVMSHYPRWHTNARKLA
ncbi:hypothetical protein [Nocardioides bruguierae]|uniref:hypothetical protein n=1 Tax=Nocardioides bruguierae TaxID=2945102 RepID=UPI002021307B|nr:hypothetical protein [Nocardioides bruguierae]MCL8026307.1 hypothetical protein [Nocardioides bruguierae]